MRRKTLIVGMLLALAVLTSSLLVLMAQPMQLQPAHKAPIGGSSGQPPFQPCPTPSCMAPCSYPAPSQVVCREADGSTTVTSYTCCCCGSSEGISFRPL